MLEMEDNRDENFEKVKVAFQLEQPRSYVSFGRVSQPKHKLHGLVLLKDYNGE